LAKSYSHRPGAFRQSRIVQTSTSRPITGSRSSRSSCAVVQRTIGIGLFRIVATALAIVAGMGPAAGEWLPQHTLPSIKSHAIPCADPTAEKIVGADIFMPFVKTQFAVRQVRSLDGACIALSALAARVCGANTPFFLTRTTKDQSYLAAALVQLMLGPALFRLVAQDQQHFSFLGTEPETSRFVLGGFSCRDSSGRRVGPAVLWMVQDRNMMPLNAPLLAGVAAWEHGSLNGYAVNYRPSGIPAVVRMYDRGHLEWELHTDDATSTSWVYCDPSEATADLAPPGVEVVGRPPHLSTVSSMCREYRAGRRDGLKIIAPE